MLVVISGQRPYPIRTEEFVLIEHARQNPAQPVLIYECSDAALTITEMARPGRMNALAQFGHTLQAFPDGLQSGPRLLTLIWMSRSSGDCLAYSTKTSK
jgi:hypothetical protein